MVLGGSWWLLVNIDWALGFSLPLLLAIGYLLLFNVFGGSCWSLAGIDIFKSEYNPCIGGFSGT